MAKAKYPVSPAIRQLNKENAVYVEQTYKYVEHGGTEVSATELGVDEHSVIKTLVMEDENKAPFIVLMHGDLQVSTKNLARVLGVKSVMPCSPETAFKHTGYLVGGTSPFGTRKNLKIYMEESILKLSIIYINGGKRGFLVSIDPKEVVKILNPAFVNVGISG